MRVTSSRHENRSPSSLISGPFAMLCALSLLAGCSQISSHMPGGNALSVDPQDPCGAERAEFLRSKDYFTDEIVTGTLTGAAVGALSGATIGLLTNNNVGKSALIGGGVGAVAGGTTAYTRTVAQNSRDQAEMAQRVNADLRQEGQQIDHTAATFARLRKCRFAQAGLIKTQVHNGTLTRQAGLTQLSWERDRFDEEIERAHEYNLTMAKRGSEFQDAADTLRAHPTPASASSTRLVTAQASVSIPEKRETFDKSVDSAESSSKVAFDIDSTARLSLRFHADHPA
jgi:outer membrane lipoprotein SlyB